MTQVVRVQQQNSQTLILRQWIEEGENGRSQRYRLENPRTGAHWSFVHLADVFNFLELYFKETA